MTAALTRDRRAPSPTGPARLVLRPAGAADDAFLLRVYASTRLDELAAVPWSAAEREVFLRQQHVAQGRHYAAHFPAASFDVIERDGQAVGRLYVDRRADEIRIVDIALLAEHRGQGVGTRLIGALLEEARGRGVAVRIHVEHTSPARGWYQRLGFRAVEDRGLYLLMEWRAEAER